MSQFTAYLTNCPLPPYLRMYIYKAFGLIYGVKFDEIKIQDINKFRTFNQFFTRELKDGVRPIENEFNHKTLCSPCDGKVLSFGQIDTMTSTMDCIKGHTYRLDEFLFGVKSPESVDPKNKTPSVVDSLIEGAKARGNQIMYCIIYLAPGDYHRYHSPANFIANYRRHIAGYLEPVRPDYLQFSKDVIKNNERVNILGEWTHGLFALSFIGALNVGSIIVNFDDTLKSNIRSPEIPYYIDRNYQTLMQSSNIMKFPVRNKLITQEGDQITEKVQDDDLFSISKYLQEFDIKDVVDISKKETTFKYEISKEQQFKYNVMNGFKDEEQLGKMANNINEQEKQELLSKLENPDVEELSRVQRYTITNAGVILKKGEEIGMFEMGSTVGMIFECPKDYVLNLKEGQKVVLGQEILSQQVPPQL
ncbi:phosphatidylserine decarboxylase [Stylonychia lemnae]|uniref:phosphatidylserine decarboxylase n=1 Tax=Stylonychia lemnae TaxID=5949 RepID=A0A078A5Y6_STYLE|nr:phosphatidylserine decarboxylase [Stylonychia lemnae]|eukprot:CDW77311.1 phosphatidylserine decarboxylase [Stylonychia lemnae]